MDLLKGEADALAVIAAYLNASDFDEAVELLEATEAGLDAYAEAARLLPDSLVDAQPAGVGRYLVHLMRAHR